MKDVTEERPKVGQLVVLVRVIPAGKTFESPVKLLEPEIYRWTERDEETARVGSRWPAPPDPGCVYWADATDALRSAHKKQTAYVEQKAQRARECLKESEARYGL